MMKRTVHTIVYFFILLVFTQETSAQNDLKRADWYYNDMQYQLAIPVYSKILNADNTFNKLEITEKLANCYRLTNNFEKAEELYRLALQIPYYSPSSIFYYAEMLRCNEKYDEAENQYKLYSVYVPEQKDRMNELIQSCITAKQWIANPEKIIITNEKILNSKFSEWGITFNKKGIVFCSDRQEGSQNLSSDGWTGASYYKIYTANFSSRTKTRTNFSKPKLYDKLINNKYHNASPNISSDETAIYFVRTGYEPGINKTEAKTYVNRSEIFAATITNSSKSLEPRALPINNKLEYSVVHPFINEDGTTLFFASDKAGGYGSFDIYYCRKNTNGSWSDPVNLGPEVNTAEAEGFPFISGDSVLYFSSKGHTGMGGFDIFKTQLSGNQWKNCVNLGFPINSSRDDISFYLLKDQKHGYFSSNRSGGTGNDDIYFFEK
jgi:tetratricopeptide (TPR) repeat protein